MPSGNPILQVERRFNHGTSPDARRKNMIEELERSFQEIEQRVADLRSFL
jgi:hypothetical protein